MARSGGLDIFDKFVVNEVSRLQHDEEEDEDEQTMGVVIVVIEESSLIMSRLCDVSVREEEDDDDEQVGEEDECVDITSLLFLISKNVDDWVTTLSSLTNSR